MSDYGGGDDDMRDLGDNEYAQLLPDERERMVG